MSAQRAWDSAGLAHPCTPGQPSAGHTVIAQCLWRTWVCVCTATKAGESARRPAYRALLRQNIFFLLVANIWTPLVRFRSLTKESTLVCRRPDSSLMRVKVMERTAFQSCSPAVCRRVLRSEGLVGVRLTASCLLGQKHFLAAGPGICMPFVRFGPWPRHSLKSEPKVFDLRCAQKDLSSQRLTHLAHKGISAQIQAGVAFPVPSELVSIILKSLQIDHLAKWLLLSLILLTGCIWYKSFFLTST